MSAHEPALGGVDLTFCGAWQAHEIARTARMLDGLRIADAQLSRNGAGFWARLPDAAEALHGETLTALFRALAGYAGR